MNPDGVKRDFAMSNDGERRRLMERHLGRRHHGRLARLDGGVPDSALAAPLRHAPSQHTFGFGVWRDIERYNERDGLAALLADAKRHSARSSGV